MSKASNQGGQSVVEISITTYDRGDETILFTAIGGKVTVKEPGRKAQPIELEAAVARMTELALPGSGWGVTHQLVKRPAWAV
ncbi:hypothetical protein [Sorangium sp. So ce233]|uniref:hypothetical protein n=1 Tax=Sorangium sp. So ce233 TaxID=3133290 RepID=UPI003F639416